MPSRATIYLYILSSGSVLLLAVSLCLLHRRRHRTRASDYAWGAGTWLISVALKTVLALGVFGVLALANAGKMSLAVNMVITGLLTGMTECVLTWLVGHFKRWRAATWESVVAFGLGFGCFEAFALAALLLPSAVMAMAPEWLNPQDAKTLLEGLSSTHRPFTFILERAIAVPVHLLASVLLLEAVQRLRISLFWWGFALKSLIDAVPAEGQIPELLLEGIYLLFGIVSLVCFLSFRSAMKTKEPENAITESADHHGAHK